VLLLLDRVFPGEVLGYGFPRFLEMLHLQGARVKRRWMVVKTLGSAVSLGAGAAVGREGPIAQIGGSIGSAVAQLARLSSEQRKILIACGAAAGIATTFKAPLGALMFAHEIVLLGEVRLVNFTQIVIATTTAVIVARGRFGSLPVFVVPGFSLERYWECFTYAALGVLLGRLARAGRRLRGHLLHRGEDGAKLPGALDAAPARADGTARLLRAGRPRRLPRRGHARAAHRDLPPLRDDPELRRRHPGADHHHPEPHDRDAARAGVDRHARSHRGGEEPARTGGPAGAGAHPRRDRLPARD